MICALMDRSSALTGSSQISSFGSTVTARAMETRGRGGALPPLRI